jgi:hypothetical protein
LSSVVAVPNPKKNQQSHNHKHNYQSFHTGLPCISHAAGIIWESSPFAIFTVQNAIQDEAKRAVFGLPAPLSEDYQRV